MCKHSYREALLPILIFASCVNQPKSERAMAPIAVQTTLAEVDSTAFEREFIGYLESNFSAVIQPRVNAFLTASHYKNGAHVRRGQLLFTLDRSQLQSASLEAAASLESARANLIEARNNYERAVPLVRIEAISKAQFDQYEAQYQAAAAAVRSAEEALHRADLQVGYTRISSPIDGIAASTAAHAGDYVGPGTQFEVLTTISNMDTLSVDLALPMREYLALGGGNDQDDKLLKKIRLFLSDGTRYPYEGCYGYTHKDVSSGEGTLLLSVNFPNPDQTLRAGQFARVKAEIGAPQGVITIPQEAVTQAQGVNSVWVVGPDSTLTWRRVEVGETIGSRWQIRSGLQAGERVLLTGLQKVKSGEHVTY